MVNLCFLCDTESSITGLKVLHSTSELIQNLLCCFYVGAGLGLLVPGPGMKDYKVTLKLLFLGHFSVGNKFVKGCKHG